MTEYTPTTDEVREAAAKGFSRSNGYNSVAPDEFEHWLKRVRNSQQLAERERIVALLESIRGGDNWIGREYAIALIKGEEQ